MTQFAKILETLVGARVEFIVIGGMAATTHGSARLTNDVDVVYRRTAENLDRVVAALASLEPYLRGAPPGLPFRWDLETVRHGLNFTLTTKLGSLDVLGEVTGGGGYEELLPFATRITVAGVECLCLGLEKLIAVKRAAGRPKDLEVIAELEALRDERSRPKT